MWSDDYTITLHLLFPFLPTATYLDQLRTLHLHLPRASRYEIKAALIVPQLDSLHLHSCDARGWLNRLSMSPDLPFHPARLRGDLETIRLHVDDVLFT